MVGRFAMAVAVAVGVCFASTQVMAQDAADFTKDELKCELGAAKALSKQVSAQSKCVATCVKAQRKVAPFGNYSSCLALASTDPCVTDPVKGSAAKASASIVKSCAKDCPACYAGSECTNGQPFVSTTQGLSATQGPLVYCVESNAGLNNGAPTKEEAKCEDETSKTLAKLVTTISKCGEPCVKGAQAGKIPFTDCAPALGAGAPPPTNSKLLDCLSKGTFKAAAAIDKACSLLPAGCYNSISGTAWTSLVRSLLAGQADDIVCGSPSGAFMSPTPLSAALPDVTVAVDDFLPPT